MKHRGEEFEHRSLRAVLLLAPKSRKDIIDLQRFARSVLQYFGAAGFVLSAGYMSSIGGIDE